MTALLTPFPYFGGKQLLAPKIVDLLPEHDHYIEPFAGSLAVLLAKPPSKLETVNDLDERLVTFWRVLREQPGELERACALTPHSRAEYVRCLDLSGDLGDLEVARRVWTTLNQGRARAMQSTGWKQVITDVSTVMGTRLANRVAAFAPAAARLANVQLECRDALDVIDVYGRTSNCALYVDPPYLGATRAGEKYYGREMADEDGHHELLTLLNDTPARVILSGYDAPLYRQHLPDWERAEVAATAASGAARTEVLWMNYQPEPTLFDQETP